jgi:hypothetical protein
MNTWLVVNVKFCKNIWICKFLCFSGVLGCGFVFWWFLDYVLCVTCLCGFFSVFLHKQNLKITLS